jgi:hypothetical protein
MVVYSDYLEAIMRRVLVLILICVLGFTDWAAAADKIDTNGMSVASVLEDVLRRLPNRPVYISGRLETRVGRKKRTQNLEATVNFASSPMSGSYTISDSFGRSLERLTISRTGVGALSRTYSKGDPLRRSAPPQLSGPIQGTAVRWSDLTLAFLWWRQGSIIGTDKVKGRPCIVMNVIAPKDEPTDMRQVKLWIDLKYVFLMRAEELSDEGKPVRRLSVKSFKKVGDAYMVKDIEIEDFKAKTETKLRIDELSDLAEKLK